MATIVNSGMQAGLAVQRAAVVPLQRQLPQWRTHRGRTSPKSKPAVTRAQGRGQQAANAAKKPVKAAQQTSLFQGLAEAQSQLNDSNVSWKTFLGLSLLAGVTFGSFIQVSHNNPNLPVYDHLTFNIDVLKGQIQAYDPQNFSLGIAKQSGLVPLLLAPIWLLFPYLQVLTDQYNADDPATVEANSDGKAGSLAYNLLLWGSITAAFLLSGFVYLNDFPHWQCSLILSVTAFLNWKAFDNTKQGLFLAALLTVGAPLTETVIVNGLHLWHYDRPDFFGVPHWAGWCYAQYATGTGNFGRYLWKKLQS
ncbi:hypothetical protein ABBQ32_002851 [Trebouxia sp. C0010 RCD-2024]